MKLVLAASLMLVFSCTKHDVDTSDAGLSSSEISIPLNTTAGNYETPTRMSTADETTVGGTPWVLVFYGEGDLALFAQAVQASIDDGKPQITVKSYAGKARLLIVANPPATFYDGTSTYAFDEANLTTRLAGKTLAEATDILLTDRLPSPQIGMPFIGETIPMTNVMDVDRIDSSISIGTPDDKFMVIRTLAKIVVSNTEPSFNMEWATVVNAPRNVKLYRAGSDYKSNAGNLTDYQDGDGELGVAPALDQTTKDKPIYIYESSASDGTAIIVRGIYAGKTYYYKLGFHGDLPLHASIPVVRNTIYQFTMKRVQGPGYESFAEAKVNPSLNVEYEVTVTDLGSYEITDNGKYYVGLSNSVFFQFYPYNELYGSRSWPSDASMDDIVVATVYTDAPTSVITNRVTISSPDGRVTLLTPTVNVTGAVASTDIRVKLQPLFTAATVTVAVGNITKTIRIIGSSFSNSAFGITLDYSLIAMTNFTSAEIVDYGTEKTEWMKLQSLGVSEDHINLKEPGEISLYISPNETQKVRQNGVIYLSSQGGVRYKTNIIQDTYVFMTYLANGSPDSDVVQKFMRGADTQVELPSNIGIYPPSGMSFKEWNTKSDGTGSNVYVANVVTMNEDYFLYAIWE